MFGTRGRFLTGIPIVIALLLLTVWLVLESSWLSGWRISRIESELSKLLGQPVIIEGDVGAALYPSVHLYVSSVTIPSQSLRDVDLAVLTEAELHLDALKLLQGEFSITEMKVDNLQVDFLTLENGETSWSTASGRSELFGVPGLAGKSTDAVGIDAVIAFLLSRNIEFGNIDVAMNNRKTGFEFQFLLDHMKVEREPRGEGTTMAGHGHINGQEFALRGEYPEKGPFRSAFEIGDLSVVFAGEFIDRAKRSYRGRLVGETENVGQLFEMLRLDRSFEGRGKLETRLTRENGTVSADELKVDAEMVGGQALSIRGEIADVLKLSDVRLRIDADLTSPDDPEKLANQLEDFQLLFVAADVTSVGHAFSLNHMLIGTNMANRSLQNIGPITAQKLVRTDDNALSLSGISINIGEPGAFQLKAEGEIRDLLRLRSFEVKGNLVSPANEIFGFLPVDDEQVFGNARAEFKASDEDGELRLSQLNIRTESTDLWDFSAQASVGNIAELGDVLLKFDLDVADGFRFLKALNLDPVKIGHFGLSGEIQNSDGRIHSASILTLGGSRIYSWLNASRHGGRPVIRGAIESERVALQDIQAAAGAGVHLVSLAAGEPSSDSEDLIGFQPLVLPPANDADQQPPVLGGAEPQIIGQDPDDWEEQPLSLGRTGEPLVLESILNVEELLRNADLKIGLEVKKLVGQAGVSRISSDLKINKGQLEFGPLKVHYGGGKFAISAAMDLIRAPNTLLISGSVSGWELGSILRGLGIEIPASGTLAANFDLHGDRSSMAAFLKSLSGSAYVAMHEGVIGTSILELAGLGVIPWLFSRELHQNYTNIACVVAPLTVQNGLVRSGAVVVETRKVQLVVKGEADWRNDQISLRAEPRPVGKPLARSPWPFEVIGRLSKPEVRVLESAIPSQQSPLTVSEARKPCKPDAAQLD